MIIFELIYIAYADLEASGGWRFQPPNPENLIYKKIIDLPTKNRPLTPPPHPSKQIKLSLRPPIKNFLIRAFTNWCTIIWGRNNPQGGKSHNRKPTNVHDITLPKICKYKSLCLRSERKPCSYHLLSLGVREAYLLSTCRHKEPLHEISLQLPLRSLMKTNTGWKNMILISVHILCFGLFGGPFLKGKYIAFFETFLKIDHIIRVTSKPKM